MKNDFSTQRREDAKEKLKKSVMPQQKVTDKICAERAGERAHLPDLLMVLAGLFNL